MPITSRKRRWLIGLSLLAVLLLSAAWWIDRQLEPERLTATVLQRVCKSLQLDLRFEGKPEYALKPEPRLLIPNFSARGLDGKVFLSARHAEISLPWATITGGEPVVTRIELDRPVLDVAAMQRWLASRPAVPFKIPTLTNGLQVRDGTVIGDGFAVRSLALALPRLQDAQRAELSASGKLETGDSPIAFKVMLDIASAGLDSDFKLDGNFELPPAETSKDRDAQVRGAGHYAVKDTFTTRFDSLRVTGTPPLPDISGRGHVDVSDALTMQFTGVLVDWPKGWPALPQPLADYTKNLPVNVAYSGKPDFGDPLSLTVVREETELRASVRIAELNSWMAQGTAASPLPPLNGSLSTPSLVFDDVKLEGVQIQISDSPAAASTP